ncbi:MAG: TetR/AcrR family transcriptional regulator [Betaproteobacteria bacterium]|jgi:AcrR family transcriptional regulator
MGRPRTAAFDLQRTIIRREAACLFADRGFPGASMADIARSCGVSKPLLYHYYRDKCELLFDIADSYMERLLVIADGVQREGLDRDAHLRTLIARFMAEYEHSQAQHRVLVQDVKFLGKVERNHILSKERRVVEIFTALIAGLQPSLSRPAPPVPLAMILFGMINWTFTWLRPDGPLSYADMAGIVADVFLHGVSGPPAACGLRHNPDSGTRESTG